MTAEQAEQIKAQIDARNDDLQYEFSVSDSTYYTPVWKGETRLHRSNLPMLEYACDGGNYSLRFALQGARIGIQGPSKRSGENRVSN